MLIVRHYTADSRVMGEYTAVFRNILFCAAGNYVHHQSLGAASMLSWLTVGIKYIVSFMFDVFECLLSLFWQIETKLFAKYILGLGEKIVVFLDWIN